MKNGLNLKMRLITYAKWQQAVNLYANFVIENARKIYMLFLIFNTTVIMLVTN